jgi:hypothetical protein
VVQTKGLYEIRGGGGGRNAFKRAIDALEPPNSPWHLISATQPQNGLETHLKPLIAKGIISESGLAEEALAENNFGGKRNIYG